MKFSIIFLILMSALLSIPAEASIYTCRIEKKIDRDYEYSSDQIKNGDFSINVEERENETFAYRCSYVLSKGEATCDKYLIDRTEITKTLDNRIFKKFYYFRGQFDIQIFPDLTFLENNGRGGVAYGICQIRE